MYFSYSRVRYARVLLSFFGLGNMFLSAQTSAAAGGASPPVTVQLLVERALANNADLQAVRKQVAEAQGLLRQSGLRPNPALETSYGTGAAFNSPALKSFSIAYSHTFELGAKRQRRLEVSEAGLRLAQLLVADQERLLRAEVQTRFAEARAAQVNLEIVTRLLALNQETLNVTTARVQQGEAARLEEGLISVEVNRLQSDRTLLEGQMQRAILALKPLAGLPLDTPLEITGSLVAKQLPLESSAAIEAALTHRPDLLAARQEQPVREAELRSARADAVPNLVGTLTYSRNDDLLSPPYGLTPAGNLSQIRDLDHMLSAGISINLPIRNRNQGNIEAAVARRDASGLRSQYLEQVVGQEVRAAINRSQTARQALAVFDQKVLGQAQDNVSILQAAYKAGEVRLFEVLNEQRRLVDTQRTYTEVLRENFLAEVELERAIGEALP